MIFLERTAPTIEKEEKKSNDKFVFGLMLPVGGSGVNFRQH